MVLCSGAREGRQGRSGGELGRSGAIGDWSVERDTQEVSVTTVGERVRAADAKAEDASEMVGAEGFEERRRV